MITKKRRNRLRRVTKSFCSISPGQTGVAGASKFDKEVLSQPQFKEYAHNHLVLVELDFPRAKAQSVELRRQNMQLAQQYDVVGFPTIIAVNSDGQKLWEYNGYFPGGPDAFIEELQKLRKG